MKQPQACFDCGCPLAGKSKGFALGSGDPKTAKLAVLLETPASTEISYIVKYLTDGEAEIDRRTARFPAIADTPFVRLGAPIVGPSGNELFNWALARFNLQRSDLFIENVLHCWPPQERAGSHYPTGKDRRKAEGSCLTLWNRLDEFAPTAAVVNFHPAALLREVTPLPIQIRAFERAVNLTQQGHRVVVCCGGKASDAWFGYASNVTRWAGHFQVETEWTRTRRAERWDSNRRISMVKVKREKKLTVKSFAQLVLQNSLPVGADPSVTNWRYEYPMEMRVQLATLLEPKQKKTTVEQERKFDRRIEECTKDDVLDVKKFVSAK